jgi:3-deoxy-manno-octulosonate cytidylyltransferase (CMP-KDO synthetase)
MSFIVVIPARYHSMRLPGKPLLELGGKPMIQHVFERALLSDAEQVYVATDSSEIQSVCEAFGAQVIMTDPKHVSGSDRIEEVTRILGLPNSDIVVNVQGDEPLIPPRVINQVADNLKAQNEASLCTLYADIDNSEDISNPNAVKVVTDQQGMALYFSRAAVPYQRDPEGIIVYKRHVGLYAYRVGALRDFVTWPVGELEQYEKLEQLRFIENGIKIHLDKCFEPVPGGIDTEADYQIIKSLLENSQQS